MTEATKAQKTASPGFCFSIFTFPGNCFVTFGVFVLWWQELNMYWQPVYQYGNAALLSTQ